MKKQLAIAIYLFSIIFLGLSTSVTAENVIISQVLYDPAGTEVGGEAVELYNPTDNSIDISEWVLQTESSMQDVTIPTGTILTPRTYYLIADSGWILDRDNTSWPEADHEEPITMSNTNAGVALVHVNESIMDAIGWGDPIEIDTGLFEHTPSPEVNAGNSLARINIDNDTNNNNADFIETIPLFHNSSTTNPKEDQDNSEKLSVEVSIENNIPVFDMFKILNDEDNSTSGVQVIPMPEGVKLITVSVSVTDLDGTEPTIWAVVTGPSWVKNITMNKINTINSTTNGYNGTIAMQFYDEPGNYTVTLLADDGSENSSANISFEYLRMAAVSIDSTSLRFSEAALGSDVEITGDFALSTTDSPTIKNTGNTNLDIGLYSTDLTDGPKTISATNIRYSFNNNFDSAVSGQMENDLNIHNLDLPNAYDSVMSLGFQLHIPQNTLSGNYTGQITLVAVSE